MSCRIRHFKVSDYDESIAIWEGMAGMGVSAADEKDRIEKFIKLNTDTCFVAVDGNKIIGTVLCGSDLRRGYLYHLAVLPGYRKRGIARELVNRCLNGLKKHGVDKCHLFVKADNAAAVEYYKKLGWDERRDIVVFSKNI